MRTFTGHKARQQLVAQGNYSSISNYWTKISVVLRGTFGTFRGVSKFLYNLLVLRFLAEPATTFCEILVGKHCSTIKMVA
jgi:hypothetical protein